MKEELIAALSAEHTKWLSSTISCEVISAIRKHRETLVRTAGLNASNESTSDGQIRRIVSNINNTDAILRIMLDFEKLKEIKLRESN